MPSLLPARKENFRGRIYVYFQNITNITSGMVMIMVMVMVMMMIMIIMVMRRRRRKTLCSPYMHMNKLRLMSVETI